MPKPFKVPQPKEPRKEKGERRRVYVSYDRPERTELRTAVTPEMLRAAAAAHLSDQHTTLWSRAFNIIDEDAETAVDWLAEQVEGVLGELGST